MILALAIIFLINTKSYAQQKTLYDFKVENVDGEVFDFSKLKGKKVLVVNVASKCGLTPQYEKLQELYDKYKEQDFEIIAFPANNWTPFINVSRHASTPPHTRQCVCIEVGRNA